MTKKFGRGTNPLAAQAEDEKPELDLERGLGEQALERTFGKINIPESGRQIVQPIALYHIHPDPAQPRRTIPRSIEQIARRDGISEWQAWHRTAEQLSGQTIDLARRLRGEGDGAESEPLGISLVDSFLALTDLAASIYRDGLINPISVFAAGAERYQIETGEGRWWAHRMLYDVLNEEKWAKIPARVVDKPDVWRQAAENGARRPLNAIGMARQLALLVMELWRGRDGAAFVPYGKMIQAGDVDRKFYAQVADGNIWRIPKGQSERILQVTGLKSKSQLQQYRALLGVSDEVWVKADEENWAEFKIREMVRPPTPTQDRSTAVDLSSQNMNQLAQKTPQKEGQVSPYPNIPNATGGPLRWPLDGPDVRYMWHNGKRVQLEHAALNRHSGAMIARVWALDENGQRTYSHDVSLNALQDGPPYGAQPHPTSNPSPSLPAVQGGGIQIGGVYRQGARHYEVVGIMGSQVRVAEISPATGKRLGATMFTLNAQDLKPIETPTAAPRPPRQGSPAPSDHWLTPGTQVINPARSISGEVYRTEWDESAQDYYAHILTPRGERLAFLGKHLRLARSEDPTPSPSPLRGEGDEAETIIPQHKWAVGMNVIWKKEGYPLIEGRIVYVSQGFITIRDIHTDRLVDVAGDESLSLREDAPQTIPNETPLDETPLDDSPPITPREFHPQTQRAHGTQVISQSQHHMGALMEMARALDMKDDTNLIMTMKALTSNGLRQYIQQNGATAVHEWLDMLHGRGVAVLEQMAEHINQIIHEAHWVVNDIEAGA